MFTMADVGFWEDVLADVVVRGVPLLGRLLVICKDSGVTGTGGGLMLVLSEL
jgi:hypothetical protein